MNSYTVKRGIVYSQDFPVKEFLSRLERLKVIGHFRITFSLFLKASIGAHPFI